MGLFRKETEPKKVTAARAEFAAAKSNLVAIDARGAAALEDSKLFAIWSAERQAAAVELDRLERLVAALIAGDEASQKNEADAAIRKRAEFARKNNAAVAERLRTEYPKLVAELKALARDIAASQIETDAVNRALPEGMTPLQDANNMVRACAAIPRENISEKKLNLWVRASDGGLLGDQDGIVDVDGRTGHLFVNRTRVDCVKREFLSVQYHPEIRSEIAENFHTQLRLPNATQQGVDFDGQWMVEEQVAAIDLNPPKSKKSRRPVQTELTPTEPWAPADVSSDAEVSG